MFLGSYEHSVDQKGRIAIPARYRDRFSGGLIAARGFEHCINVYPKDEWDKLAEQLSALPFTRPENRRLSRATFASAFDLELDKQGRIVLPQALRDYAGVGDQAVIAGVNTYLEIWDLGQWQQELATAESAGIGGGG